MVTTPSAIRILLSKLDQVPCDRCYDCLTMSDLSNTFSYALLPTQISLNQTSALSRRCRCGPSMPDIMLQSPCVMLCRNIVLPSACHVPSLMLSAYASKAAGTASSDHSAGRTVILEILVTSQVLTEITYSESPLLTASCRLVMNLQIPSLRRCQA